MFYFFNYRPPPKNGFTGSPHELITEGGELEFCRKMIKESKEHKDKVMWVFFFMFEFFFLSINMYKDIFLSTFITTESLIEFSYSKLNDIFKCFKSVTEQKSTT